MIVDGSAVNRVFARNALNRAGWRTIEAVDGLEALVSLNETPSLIIIPANMDGMSGREFAAELRGRHDAFASIPIIALIATHVGNVGLLHDLGFDDVLARPYTAAELVAVAERWRPEGMPPGPLRLEQVFGSIEMASMIAGLRDLLEAALDGLDKDDAAAVAHRVAGIAGILGFSDLGRDWRLLSEGKGPATATLRRRTRLAIAEIDRNFELKRSDKDLN
ncbi:response regulator [Sphingomonas sp. BIUV-7]|uniref:Response regulator n=1 Tax=Sphingomonas natans TaxID=3063330 RepID=A0ABT8YCZ3_9SPHN|nr:response regulator [Sphingomonas sp. BIUV-7]MDO6415812.1 response regulator [Sphingomonas sp. BIUV-7]